MGKQKQMLIGVLSAAVMACGGGGSGDEQKQQTATGEDPCRVRPLEEACANGTCPSSPDEVPRECGSMFPTERYATTCGGTMMSRSGGFSGANWVFDENDELVGLETWLDLPHECADGTRSFSTLYGSVCEPEGEAMSVCETAP
jgi:hypothetical protein